MQVRAEFQAEMQQERERKRMERERDDVRAQLEKAPNTFRDAQCVLAAKDSVKHDPHCGIGGW